MITVAMATVIAAEPERVWRALTLPSELVAWDERLLAPVEALPDYPCSGQHARWRYRLGSVQLVMHERPLDVAAPTRLRSAISLGSLRYEQTFTLTAVEEGERAGTRLAMKVVASNSIPVVGDVVDRFEVRKLATGHVDATLRALQSWCERHPG